MKDHELKAIDLALAEFPLEVPKLAPTLAMSVEKSFMDTLEPDVTVDQRELEVWVANLTTLEALEVAYRLLGRLLENVSSWRRLLRWAIGKVMELLAGAKERV